MVIRGISIFIKSSSSNSSMKSEIGVSSFSSGFGFRIAEVGDGSSKGSGLAI